MSNYSMSPPNKPAPLPYPYQNAGSPTNGGPGYSQPPPAKRQRLSPPAGSPVQHAQPYAPQPPYAAPSIYGNPYAPQQPAQQQSPYGSPSTYAGSPQSFNTPQYHPQWSAQQTPRQMSPQTPQAQGQSSTAMMPPPPRPNKEEKEERMNIDDIGDSLYGSGVSIKDEENYLLNAYNNRHTANDSFASTQGGTSFGSSTMSPNHSFNLLTQGTSFGSHGGAFAGTLGQAQSQEQIEAEVKRKRADAARARNEANQHPMNNQFTGTNAVRARLMRVAAAQGVVVNTQGLWQRQGPPAPQADVMMNGQGTDGIAAVDTRPEFTATRGDAFEQLMSLMDLASGERMRGLVEDAFALSRARQFGDHGRVPVDFQDIAQSNGERQAEMVIPENVSGSQWDRIPGSDGPAEQANGVNGTSSTPQPQPTISFSSAITTKLRELARRDEAAERARIAKREARKKREAAAAATAAGEEQPDSAPEAAQAPITKISKKEQARKDKEAKLASAQSSQANANATVNHAIKGKMNRYSWMTAGAATPDLSNRYKAPAPEKPASGTSTPALVKVEGAGGGAVGSPVASGSAMGRVASDQGVKVLEWGDWREDGGIQARDWVLVLERDGKQKMALQRLFNRLGMMETGGEGPQTRPGDQVPQAG